MKKAFLGLAILAVAVLYLLSGCAGIGGAAIKDCGTDKVCFNNSLQICERAKVTLTETSGGAIITQYAEIKGGTVEACSIYGKIEEISQSPDATAQQITQINLFKLMVEGKDMTCVRPVGQASLGITSDLTACVGTLADVLKTMQPQFSSQPMQQTAQ